MRLLLTVYAVGAGLLIPTIIVSAVRHRRELLVRCLSQLAMISVIAMAVAWGEPGVILLGTLLAALSLRDVYALRASGPAVALWSVPLMALPFVGVWALSPERASLALFALFLLGVAGVLRGLRQEPVTSSTQAFLIIAVGAGFAAFMQLGRHLGVAHLLAALLLVQVNDSFAYLGGKRWGRRRLAPRVSPGKTVEGSLCGLGATALFGLLLCSPWLPAYTERPWLMLAGVLPIVVLLGTGGDLLLSLAKRRAGLKDFPTFMPGHGGVLDRFDSLVGLAPALLVWATSVTP